MNVGEATCGVGEPVSHAGHTHRSPDKRSQCPQPSPAARPRSCEPGARAMPPWTGVGERCAPRATWSCIDELLQPAGRSRSASLPTPVQGRAGRHRLLRAPGMSHVAAIAPRLKLPGMLDEPAGSLPRPRTAHLLRGTEVAWEAGTRWRAAADVEGRQRERRMVGRAATLGTAWATRWRTGSLRWREHSQRSQSPQWRDAGGWAALLRRRVVEAHAHAWLLQRSRSDSWS